MRTKLPSISLALLGLTLGPPPVRAGGEIAVYGIRHEPVGRMRDFVDGSWGGGAQALFDASNRHPGLSLGIGAEYVSLHAQAGRKEDYFRLFGGTRFRFLGGRMLRPYADVHVALVRHAVTTPTYAFRDWGGGYDVGVGLHLNPFDRVTGFAGLRTVQSFGLKGEGANSEIEIDPRYWDAYGGIAWTFGFLELDGGG